MNKTVYSLLLAGCAVSFLFTFYYAMKSYQAESIALLSDEEDPFQDARYRIAFISSEEGNPFWDELRDGVQEAAEEYDVSLQMWRTFRSNPDEIMRHMDIGIAANVDGMIVEGMDNPAFAQTVHHASANGIPVITVVTDTPDSLRRTYVGSNQVLEGRQIGRSIADRVQSGKIGLITGGADTHAFRLRLEGMLSALSPYDELEIVQAERELQAEDERAETRNILNQHPDCRVFVAFRSGSATGIYEEIRTRSRPELFSIYAFDDLPETISLFKQGKIHATIRHKPKQIGQHSLELMVRWLENEALERYDYIPFELVELDNR